MFSFLTNTSTALALSAIGLKILASVKFKTHFLGNIVPALFISLMFVGCGGGDSDEPPRVADISTQADLASINGRSSYLAGHYTLVNDITLDTPSGAGWTPIGTSANPFRGTFNGNGFVIRGLKVNRTSADYVGLFGYAHGATIRNLGVEIDSSGVKGKNYVGGIAGSFVRGSITDSYAIGKVEGRVYAGGLAGLLNKSSVSDSYFSGNINGTSGIGGIAGMLYDGSITNSYASVSANGKYTVGGLVGAFENSNIINSYAEGNINGLDNFVGGMVGRMRDANIINSYSTVNVEGGSDVGGLAGFFYSSNITRSYASGNVKGNHYVAGGLVGVAYFGSIFNNAAINQYVHAPADFNRVVGMIGVRNVISNNLALLDNNRTNNSVNAFTDFGEGNEYSGRRKTPSSAFNRTATYATDLGWRFGDSYSAPWKIHEGSSYPYLYWQDW